MKENGFGYTPYEWHNSVIAGAGDAAPAIGPRRELDVSALTLCEGSEGYKSQFILMNNLCNVVTGRIQFDVNSETIELRSGDSVMVGAMSSIGNGSRRL
jgi:hypothetical protein